MKTYCSQRSITDVFTGRFDVDIRARVTQFAAYEATTNT